MADQPTVDELIHDDEREQDFEAMAMMDEARAQFRHEVDLFELHPIRKPLQPTRGRQTWRCAAEWGDMCAGWVTRRHTACDACAQDIWR